MTARDAMRVLRKGRSSEERRKERESLKRKMEEE